MSVQYPSFIRHLKGFVKFELSFKTITGLLIRMPVHAQAYRIGGADQYPMVVKKKYKGKEIEVPYIPGSSLKGRMRSLLEIAGGFKVYTSDGKIWQHTRSLKTMNKDFFDDVQNRCVIDELFGWSAVNYQQIKEFIENANLNVNLDDIYKILAPTRLLVSDFFPTEDYVEKINAKSVIDFLEEKAENRIDRITSAADPRSIVRVKPEVEFDGEIKILLFDHDKDKVYDYIYTLATGLKLIEETYLGGSGSRGYGRIKFNLIKVNVFQTKKDNIPKLEDTEIEKEYESVDKLRENAEELAKEIKNKIFG